VVEGFQYPKRSDILRGQRRDQGGDQKGRGEDLGEY
jgi:hypothetical protein